MIQIDNALQEWAKDSLALFWQRMATIAGASGLAAFYISPKIALISFCVCIAAEGLDYIVTKKVVDWDGIGEKQSNDFLSQLTVTSVFSTLAVIQYIILAAWAEGPTVHIGPLFFLFAVALYSAMNNCQIERVLVARMCIFAAAFVFIPVYDLWLVRPPITSELWKQLGVVLFVLYFIAECTRKFLANYRTSRSQLEQLGIERDRVSQAYELQSQFVSVVSHELRTPLTSIKGSLDLINSGQMGVLPAPLSSVAEIALRNSNRLAFLIDDLLDFQKLKIGKMVFKFAELDLAKLVKDAVEINGSYGDTESVTINLIQPDAPMFVKGDPDRLMQVLTNVLSNAIKFSPAGGEVDVSLDQIDGKARVLIADHGIGIPEGSEDLVFGPFMQVDCSDVRDFGGTGLGMSISKEILDGHDGSISYTSEIGVGTTFAIQIDLLPVTEMPKVEPCLTKTSAAMIPIASVQAA